MTGISCQEEYSRLRRVGVEVGSQLHKTEASLLGPGLVRILQKVEHANLAGAALTRTLQGAAVVEVEDNAVRHLLPFLIRCKGGLEFTKVVAFRNTFGLLLLSQYEIASSRQSLARR